jgi:excisionase family DNA binding protein
VSAVLPIERLITTAQAARVLGVTTMTARHYAERGLIRAVRMPLGWLLDAEDVARLASERAARKMPRAAIAAITTVAMAQRSERAGH